MEFAPSRVRRGELIAGGGALVLLVDLFVLPWYGVKPPLVQTAQTLHLTTSVDGWDGLQHLRWLALVTVVIGFALVWFQTTRRAPAIPSAICAVLIVIALLNVLALIYRVLINEPGADSVVSQKAGAFVGLAAAIATLVGAYLSLRDEAVAPRDEWTTVEIVSLDADAPTPQS